jgi:hypothetical protein
MALKQVIEVMDILDAPVKGDEVATHIMNRGLDVKATRVQGNVGETTFLKIIVPGTGGKTLGGSAPTLGIIGSLGGIGARPSKIGLVSDADGAICAIACCLKLADMRARGDLLKGDVVICTHICPDAPMKANDPVPFMGSVVGVDIMNEYQVDASMDAILSIDTTKGNKILNRRGIAISPTVKEGWILPVSRDLLDIMEIVMGEPPVVLPLSTLDITPYGNGLPHLNSILQPSTATKSPVVGVAITAMTAVAGCATGASNAVDLELAVRFCIEVAKCYGVQCCAFYDKDTFARACEIYGAMTCLQQ